jgi:hypothetical protein
MLRLLATVLLFSMLPATVWADEATKQKLASPRYAEPPPLSTLKIAAEVRSGLYGYPDYPALPAAKPEARLLPGSLVYWAGGTLSCLMIAGYGLVRLARSRRRRDE